MNEFSFKKILSPAQIILFRHAEKELIGPELSLQGFSQANQLPLLFNNDRDFIEFGKPAAIFAAAPKKEGSSIRSIQTVTPLAQNFNMDINTSFTKKDTSTLVETVLSHDSFQNKTIVICWERSGIPVLAKLFGIQELNFKWDKNNFNSILFIRYNDSNQLSFKIRH